MIDDGELDCGVGCGNVCAYHGEGVDSEVSSELVTGMTRWGAVRMWLVKLQGRVTVKLTDLSPP